MFLPFLSFSSFFFFLFLFILYLFRFFLLSSHTLKQHFCYKMQYCNWIAWIRINRLRVQIQLEKIYTPYISHITRSTDQWNIENNLNKQKSITTNANYINGTFFSSHFSFSLVSHDCDWIVFISFEFNYTELTVYCVTKKNYISSNIPVSLHHIFMKNQNKTKNKTFWIRKPKLIRKPNQMSRSLSSNGLQ